eukprot:COSAG06_NODE_155_length_21876_cov_22.287643_16_plen_386_part_00
MQKTRSKLTHASTHHGLHEVADERRAEVQQDVRRMQLRVRRYELNGHLRRLSTKFNQVQESLTVKAVARTHWLASVKLATGLELATRAGGDGGVAVADSRMAENDTATQLGERAYAALEVARNASMGEDAPWLDAEELFFQGLEAMGRGRAEIRAELEADTLNENKNVTMAVLRWRRACTMVLTMLAIDRQNADKIQSFADELIAEYMDIEPIVTKLVDDQAVKVKGRLIGLEYKLKSESSLFRKIMSDLDEEREKEDGMDLLEVCAHCYDVLRYTCVLETADYVEGVLAVLKALDEYDTGDVRLSQFRVKNFWTGGDAYQGINSVYSINLEDAETMYFELQFHTLESIRAKEETCHVSCELRAFIGIDATTLACYYAFPINPSK